MADVDDAFVDMCLLAMASVDHERLTGVYGEIADALDRHRLLPGAEMLVLLTTMIHVCAATMPDDATGGARVVLRAVARALGVQLPGEPEPGELMRTVGQRLGRRFGGEQLQRMRDTLLARECPRCGRARISMF